MSQNKIYGVFMDPELSPLELSDNTKVNAMNPEKGYCWLGFWLSYANNVLSLIKYNLNKKTFHTCHFYG